LKKKNNEKLWKLRRDEWTKKKKLMKSKELD